MASGRRANARIVFENASKLLYYFHYDLCSRQKTILTDRYWSITALGRAYVHGGRNDGVESAV